MNLIKCFQTNSTWYKGAHRNSTPVGILWHDTGAGNAMLRRYVQPLSTDANYQEMIDLLGKNKYNNDWNHVEKSAGLNAWIGKLNDGSVATIQAGEWTTCPGGCGAGALGSCNGYIKVNGVNKYCGMHWIQFEICDDGYKDATYFAAIYKEAVELTAMLCKEFNIDPKGTVEYAGVKVPTILCHADSHKLKLGGNHGDVYPWFNKMGKTMEDVRNDVAEMLNIETAINSIPKFEKLDEVKIKEGITTFYNGATMASWVAKKTLYVRAINGNKITISTLKEGAVTGTVWDTDLVLIKKANNTAPAPSDNVQEEVKEEPKEEVKEETKEEIIIEKPAENPVETPTVQPDPETPTEEPEQESTTEAVEFSDNWIKSLLIRICEFLLSLLKK